ncbi:9691_t:CDS:2, partial [Scutellospora calospora]
MSTTSERYIQITDTDFTPHNGKPVEMIESSPNMKYIATWSEEDLSVVGWCIDDNEHQLKHEYMISQKDIDIFKHSIKDVHLITIKSFTVSDNKLVSMPICLPVIDNKGKTFYEKDIGIFDFKTKQPLRLSLSYSSYVLKYLTFLEDGNLIMIVDSRDMYSFNGYRIYVFTQKKNTKNMPELIHKSTIKLDVEPSQIFISPKGKIFIYDNDIGNITKWDIKTLNFEAHFLIIPYYDIIDIKL